ncbi:MAG TPA: NAD-dependent epimerase/dehydratase family protein, partial [bacterium]|nr:NAD-dependent epimerase/dehydratase family protein [bacterium]
ACKGRSLSKVVWASSSSVYGDCEEIPMTERSPVKPISPYGVTKLACEHLCRLYWKDYGVPTVGLRYFTVYGPRQRPDMGFHKFISALLSGGTLHVYGDGEQTRDFTYVADAVAGTLLGFEKGKEGEVYNIGGGSRVTLKEVLSFLEKIGESPGRIVYEDVQKGDMRHTLADISKARRALGYEPRVALMEGLREEFVWLKKGGRS